MLQASGGAGVPKPLEELSGEDIERKKRIGTITTSVLRYLADEFTKRGFEWLLPVIFSKTTDPLWPDPGASIEKRVEVEVYEETVRTTLSMIIHKMVACSLAYPKLFVFSPNFRVEKRERSATGWHIYEFTQLDFEMRGASSRDVRILVEKMIFGLIRDLKKRSKEELSYLGRHKSLDPLSLPSDPTIARNS